MPDHQPGSIMFETSLAQQSLWLQHQLDPDQPTYHVMAVVRLRATLEVGDAAGGTPPTGGVRLADPPVLGPRGDVRFHRRCGRNSQRRDRVPFDMRGVDLSHHAGADGVVDCSFETILRRYDLADPVLWRLAEIVHEADLDDERYEAPEARGADALVRGLSMVADDQRILDVTGLMFDGLYEYHRRGMLLGREPA